ncbi:MAG: hypothetical protein CM1200mP8_6430 [Chloroflexota bacterium]|nr:MAG: hypothetical protein CM1200mP8_6430 [Chloroflexota bacterium]
MIENNEQFIPTRIAEYLKAALIASDAASEVLMGKFRSVNPAVDAMGLSSWEKAPGELVTEADIESDQSIKSALSRTHALGDIYSEEGFFGKKVEENIHGWLIHCAAQIVMRLV